MHTNPLPRPAAGPAVLATGCGTRQPFRLLDGPIRPGLARNRQAHRGSGRAEVLPMPAQMKPCPRAVRLDPPPAQRRKGRVARANAEASNGATRGATSTPFRSGLHRWGAVPGLCGAGPGDVTIALQPGEGGHRHRGRHCTTGSWAIRPAAWRALRVRCWSSPSARDLKTNSGHHHEPAHLPGRADLHREGLDGFWCLGIPEGQDAGLQRQAQAARRLRPSSGLSLEKLRFRFAIGGGNPA